MGSLGRLFGIVALGLLCVLAAPRAAEAAYGDVKGTKFGIFYLIWHCLGTDAVYDISQNNLGPVPSFHWWSRPNLGYYCPTKDRHVLRQHAIQLRDAGMDFVYLDITNYAKVDGGSQVGALQPLQALAEEWSQIPGAPKLVPWLPLSKGADIPDAVDQILAKFPSLRFPYQGKPLLLVVANPEFPVDQALLNRFAAKYTLRQMWAYQKNWTNWSFMEECTGNFKKANGYGRCGQRIAYGPDNKVEQVSVTAAYQKTYMTQFDTAVPKFEGRTLQAQMKRIDDFVNPPIVTITGWNEWIAQRFCVTPRLAPTADCSPPNSPTLPNGYPVFVDQYNEEYSRDLEPTVGNDKYYQLLKTEVMGRKLKASQVTGYVDSASATGGGFVLVQGWACSTYVAASIDVHLYVGGPAGGGGKLVASAKANLANESAVGEACGDNGAGAHRYTLTLDPQAARDLAGQVVYVYGISPLGKPNLPLTQSGKLRLPGVSQ